LPLPPGLMFWKKTGREKKGKKKGTALASRKIGEGKKTSTGWKRPEKTPLSPMTARGLVKRRGKKERRGPPRSSP